MSSSSCPISVARSSSSACKFWSPISSGVRGVSVGASGSGSGAAFAGGGVTIASVGSTLTSGLSSILLICPISFIAFAYSSPCRLGSASSRFAFLAMICRVCAPVMPPETPPMAPPRMPPRPAPRPAAIPIFARLISLVCPVSVLLNSSAAPKPAPIVPSVIPTFSAPSLAPAATADLPALAAILPSLAALPIGIRLIGSRIAAGIASLNASNAERPPSSQKFGNLS